MPNDLQELDAVESPPQKHGALDARMVSMRYPMEVNLIGDSAATLRKLLPLLDRKPDRSWRETIEKNVKSWWEVLQNRAMNDAKPLNLSASSGNCRPSCRKGASSPATQARALTGMRAMSRSVAA
jgi:thiamine pyrophosphate-dependent acetolactate synthase large subunit-like protein